jgi:hypothetical protein
LDTDMILAKRAAETVITEARRVSAEARAFVVMGEPHKIADGLALLMKATERASLPAMFDGASGMAKRLGELLEGLVATAGYIDVTEEDLAAVTEEEAAKHEHARRAHAMRYAVVRTLRGWQAERNAILRLLGNADVPERPTLADRIALLTKTFSTHDWAEKSKMWKAFAVSRRTTCNSITPKANETLVLNDGTRLLDVYGHLGELHQKTNDDLIASREHGDKDPDTLEHDAYLEGKAHAFVYAMDLIVNLGREGFDLIKQK